MVRILHGLHSSKDNIELHLATTKHGNFVCGAEKRGTVHSFFVKAMETAVRAKCLLSEIFVQHNLPLSQVCARRGTAKSCDIREMDTEVQWWRV